MDFFYGSLVIGLVVVALIAMVAMILRKHHNTRKRKERLCECGHETVRTHQMVDDSSGHPSTPFGRYYHTYTFDECTFLECKKVKCVKQHGEKWFSLYKLLWRHLTNSSQFTIIEALFRHAGLIEVAVPPLLERMKLAQEASDKRISRMPTISIPDARLADVGPRVSPAIKLMASRRHTRQKD